MAVSSRPLPMWPPSLIAESGEPLPRCKISVEDPLYESWVFISVLAHGYFCKSKVTHRKPNKLDLKYNPRQNSNTPSEWQTFSQNPARCRHSLPQVFEISNEISLHTTSQAQVSSSSLIMAPITQSWPTAVPSATFYTISPVYRSI